METRPLGLPSHFELRIPRPPFQAQFPAIQSRLRVQIRETIRTPFRHRTRWDVWTPLY